MSVYVDELVEYSGLTGQVARAGRFWCHMTADGLEELHAMADRIGLRRAWFQPEARLVLCHYDLVPSRRARAVQFGAVEVRARTHLRQVMADGRFEVLSGYSSTVGRS